MIPSLPKIEVLFPSDACVYEISTLGRSTMNVFKPQTAGTQSNGITTLLGVSTERIFDAKSLWSFMFKKNQLGFENQTGFQA